MHAIIGMPFIVIIMGMPAFIMDIIISQQLFIMSICEASMGIILQTMPSLPISQTMRQVIMGIIGMPPVIGIIPFIIGMPPIIGIIPFIIGMPPIMPFIIGIIPFIIGMPFIIGIIPFIIGMPFIIGCDIIGICMAGIMVEAPKAGRNG